MSSASDPLIEWLSWLMEEVSSQWDWAPGSGFLNNSKFSLTWWLAQNMLPLADWAFKAALGDIPDCLRCRSGPEEARLLLLRAGSLVLKSRREVDGPHRSQIACAVRYWLRRG